MKHCKHPTALSPFLVGCFMCLCWLNYHNVPTFSDGQVWANSADPDQTAPRSSSLIRVYAVCNSLCIFWMHYSKEKPSCSTFRVITADFRVSEILGFLRYFTGLTTTVQWRTMSRYIGLEAEDVGLCTSCDTPPIGSKSSFEPRHEKTCLRGFRPG